MILFDCEKTHLLSIISYRKLVSLNDFVGRAMALYAERREFESRDSHNFFNFFKQIAVQH